MLLNCSAASHTMLFLLVASVGIIFGGFVLSYLVALCCFWLLASRRLLHKIQIHKPNLPSKPTTVQKADLLSRYNSIGIILAGGGAKGAYQAGAMKAIYEFLEEQKSHHKVKMIAGTSIGSWNALFWLAHLVTTRTVDRVFSSNGGLTLELKTSSRRFLIGPFVRTIFYQISHGNKHSNGYLLRMKRRRNNSSTI
jgi:hypothetical protein